MKNAQVIGEKITYYEKMYLSDDIKETNRKLGSGSDQWKDYSCWNIKRQTYFRQRFKVSFYVINSFLQLRRNSTETGPIGGMNPDSRHETLLFIPHCGVLTEFTNEIWKRRKGRTWADLKYKILEAYIPLKYEDIDYTRYQITLQSKRKYLPTCVEHQYYS